MTRQLLKDSLIQCWGDGETSYALIDSDTGDLVGKDTLKDKGVL
jgi:hypothetical protein